MKMSEQSRASIVSALKTALCRYTSEGDETVVTDIHLQPNSESGELIIFDDDDQELSRTIINECDRPPNSSTRLRSPLPS